MFNLSRLLRFLGKVLGFLIIISLPILGLPVTAEVMTHTPKLWGTPGFLLQVFVNVLPFVIVIAVIYWLTGRFMRDVYQLGSVKQGIGFLIRRQFGRLSFGPWLILKKGKIDLDLNGLVRKLGGPGGLIIFNDTAVVLERAGRLTRVEGPGFPALEPFESIYDIIQLGPKRRVYTVSAMSKEGIDISWDVDVQYKIADENQSPTESVPYPFSKEAIFKAATGKWRRESGRVQDMDWEGWLIISQAEATLRSILARRFLDELIGLTEREQVAAREAIQEELEQELERVAPKMGAKILQVKLDNFKVSDKVVQQWIEDWRVNWQQWSENQLAWEQARNIQTYEPAMTKAVQMPIVNLAQMLQDLDSDQARIMLLTRLLDIIGQRDLQEDGFYFLPAEAMDMLEEMIRDLSRRNGATPKTQVSDADGSSDDHDPGKKSPIPFRSNLIPISGQIAAGQEKSFLGDSTTGYIAQITEDEFVVKGDEVRPLKAQLLKGSHLKFNDAYEHFAVKVLGDSMDRAGIFSGDYIILRKPKYVPLCPTNGDIVAAIFHDEDDKATLKRIYFGFGINGVILQPDSSNSAYRPRTLSKRDFVGDNPRVEVAAIAVAVLRPQSNGDLTHTSAGD